MIEIRIKPLVKRNCFRCAGLSRRTGIPYSTMLRLYSGKCRSISLEHLDRLCEVLECSPEEILVRRA